MKSSFTFKGFKVLCFVCPGKTLSNEQLSKFHGDLVFINESSNANIDNKMLNKKLNLIDIKNYFQNVIVSIFYMNETPCAFSLSPFLSRDNLKVFHIGLTIVAKNPGLNLGGFLGVVNAKAAYENFGRVYLTNISSTPSLIESFSNALGNAYPSPNCSLKSRPKHYRNVVKILKEEYMDKCFPDQSKLQIDYKRFVLISNSSEMGFKTSFHDTSFADSMEFNNFCKTWINYEREEDLIQVGELRRWQYLKMSIGLYLMKFMARRKLQKYLKSQVLPEREIEEKWPKAA